MISSFIPDEGLFFKSIYLYDKYIAFLYFINEDYFSFEILLLNEYEIIGNQLYYEENIISLSKKVALHDFIKIDNDRLVFVSTGSSMLPTNLYIIFFGF